MSKEDTAKETKRIEWNTQREYKVNKESTIRENWIAKVKASDCYPERDKDCTDPRFDLFRWIFKYAKNN